MRIRLDRVIYMTITIMSVLIVYDGWAQLKFWGVVAVILGPVVAVFLSHVFAAGLAHRVRLGRPLTGRERRATLGTESWFLLMAVPPLLIFTVLALLGVEYTRIIQVIVAVGVLSLGGWGIVAGRRAQLTGWRLVSAGLYGLLLGLVILVVQAVLQPGQSTLRH